MIHPDRKTNECALRVGFRAELVVPVTDWARPAQLDWIGAERFFLTRLEQIDAENTALLSFTRIGFQPQALLGKENDILKVKIGKLPEGLILNRDVIDPTLPGLLTPPSEAVLTL